MANAENQHTFFINDHEFRYIGNKIISVYGVEITGDDANFFMLMNNVPLSSVEYFA
jgi:hypothetical protein